MLEINPSHGVQSGAYLSRTRCGARCAAAESTPSGNVCPARTGPPDGPNFPSKDRFLPYLASCVVRIATVRQNWAKLGKSQGARPEFSPFRSPMRAGRTLPPVLNRPQQRLPEQAMQHAQSMHPSDGPERDKCPRICFQTSVSLGLYG